MFTNPDYFDTKTPENFYKPIHFFNARDVSESSLASIDQRGSKKMSGAILGSVGGNRAREFVSPFYLEVVSFILPVFRFHCPYNISYGAYFKSPL